MEEWGEGGVRNQDASHTSQCRKKGREGGGGVERLGVEAIHLNLITYFSIGWVKFKNTFFSRNNDTFSQLGDTPIDGLINIQQCKTLPRNVFYLSCNVTN
jgi:hypothetical protein